MKSILTIWLAVLICMSLHGVSGCYLPPRFCMYNNTSKSVTIYNRDEVFNVRQDAKKKIVIRSAGDTVSILSGEQCWTYRFPVVTSEIIDSSVIIKVQIEDDGTLHILKPGRKINFPVDIRVAPECVIETWLPIETQDIPAEQATTNMYHHHLTP